MRPINAAIAGLTLSFLTGTMFVAVATASPCLVQSECVKVESALRMIDGVNVHRYADQLIKYDRSNGQTTSPANQWGYEVAVRDGKVVSVSDFQPGMPIPADGYVLSGHGSEYIWLKANAVVGARVVLPGEVEPEPTPSTTATPTTSTTTPTGPPASTWRGEYWDNVSLSGTPVLTRDDDVIDFDWPGTTGAGPGLDGSQDSARWTRSLGFEEAEYTFTVTGDDGVRVMVDGTTIIDGWKDQGPTTYQASRRMTQGVHTVVVEHYERWGGAVARFSVTKGASTTPPTTGNAATGRWSIAAVNMPLRSIHATALHDGRVLLLAGSGNDYQAFAAGSFKAAVWSPDSGSFREIGVPEDMFCSGHVTLPDGKVLIQGGTAAYAGTPSSAAYRGLRSSYIFDPRTNAFTKTANDTIEGHWYPTLTKLGSGDVWGAGGYTHKKGGGGSTSIEMFNSGTRLWAAASQVPQINRYLGTYPHMFLLADGRMLYTGGHTFGDPQPGTGSFIYDWRTKLIGDIPGLRDKYLRDQAGSVLLPPAQNQTFMIAGGGSTDYGGATDSVDLVDMKQAAPSWRAGPRVPSGQGRMYLNLTVLPDRSVLASNGATGNRTGDVKAASIYDPASNVWTVVDADPVRRNYHSSSLVLADGRVAVFGSNPADNSFELRISLYEPPYLFKGERPTVAAPDSLGYGEQVSLTVTGEVVSASLLAPMSSTHQTDTNARLVDLPITGTGATRTATVPQNPSLLPPGPYMLTVLDDKGAVSTAKWVNIR